MNYFDTSAIIKIFVEEPGSKRVEDLVAGEPRLATSRVAYAEVHAALARRHREGTLAPRLHRMISRAFDFDWLAYVQVDLVDPLLALTRDLVRRYPLPGFDAIHLASAMHLQQELSEAMQIVASDQRLLAAARSEGLLIVDVRS